MCKYDNTKRNVKSAAWEGYNQELSETYFKDLILLKNFSGHEKQLNQCHAVQTLLAGLKQLETTCKKHVLLVGIQNNLNYKKPPLTIVMQE